MSETTGRRTTKARGADIPTRVLVLGMAHTDGTIVAAELYPVAEACGQTAEQVRSCMRRLVTEGLFSRHGEGRDARFEATAEGMRALGASLERARLAYAQDSAGRGWDRRWRLVAFAIPESQRGARDNLRSHLLELGGAAIQSGLYVSPHRWEKDAVAEGERLGLAEHLSVASTDDLEIGGERDPRDLAARLWSLDELAARYAWFVERYEPVPDLLEQMRRQKRRLTDTEFLPGALMMGVEFQQCFNADPLLPPELLPRPWPGRRARELVARSRRMGVLLREAHDKPALFGPFDDILETIVCESENKMKFGIFYEHQLPRPWDEGSEHKLLKDALDQVELADRLGIDYVWEVEHHFLEEYSHSSAPEVFLAAASQRTSRIRLGHGIVQLPQGFNHTARVVERINTLDLISDGRVDFGTGESSSEAELGGFGVDRKTKRDEWTEALDAATRMMVEEPFAGYSGEFLKMPPRNVVPRCMQKPHPPLWVACSRRDTIHMAATKGIGALSFSFIEPAEAKQWVDDYYATIASEACVPAGFAVNPNLAVVLPMMCHQDEATAIERGLDGGHFFGYSLGHYYIFGQHTPGVTNVWEEFEERRSLFGFDRNIASQTEKPLGAQLFEQGLGALRGAVGTPDQIRDLVRKYEECGVDQLIFVSQAGRNRHEDICESLELFATEVMPEFADRDHDHTKRKLERLAPTIEAALARRQPARPAPEYQIGAGFSY